MPEIRNRRGCSPTEIDALKRYWSQTPVRWLVQLIHKGARVSKGEVASLSEIGELKTIWGDLGSVLSINEHGTEKFLVYQVVAALSKPQCKDTATLAKIKEYMQSYANDQLKLTITLLEYKNDILIYDGNKTAVACFEYGLERGQNNLSLPVYIVTL